MSTRRPVLAVDLLYVTGRRGGTEAYARELLPRVSQRLDGVDLVGLVGRTGREVVEPWFPGALRTLPVDTNSRPAWAVAETALVSRAARRAGADLLWCPANYGPSGRRVPTVVTVHDVIPWDYPHPDDPAVVARITKFLVGRAARGARELLTVSHDAAGAIARVLRVPSTAITVVPNGHSAPPADLPAAGGELSGLDDGRPTVLSVGNRMPHKNVDGLLRAVARLAPPQRPRVVVTGSRAGDPLVPLVTELGLENDVVLLGWVADADLEHLYALATVYVCLSFAEGFGLPVVDAMARGCAVLASDVGALREVGGDAVAYADPGDPADVAERLSRLLDDDAERERLRERGRRRAAQFGWDAAADATGMVLDRVLGSLVADGSGRSGR
ncbi:glycosyltransferase family 4 protein [Cellulomonas soli]